MQFKHPELLYSLLLLLIPIIVHLFQLRKFKKEAFTNVAFLKQVTLQTRKSSQIKKWLTLLTRLGILAAIVFAFVQPFTSKTNSFNSKNETVLYLDNSFSMQAKGDNGALLKRAVQDLITNVPDDENIALVTNNEVYKNTTIKAIKSELLQLEYSTNQLSYDGVLLKSKKLFSKQSNTIKNFVLVSDFQQKENNLTISLDSSLNVNLVQLKPVSTGNVSIDSLYISKRTANLIELTVALKNNGQTIDNLPVSLYNEELLITKTAVSIKDAATTVFTLPANEIIKGRIVIEDINLQFDNNLFFSINKTTQINVLSINEASDNYLKRIYKNEEFKYSNTKLNQLNYNDITNQNLIILNELDRVPSSLSTALKSFTNNGGVLTIIPSQNIDFQNYNSLFLNYNFTPFNSFSKLEKRLTTINYSHPLYSSVFEKRVENFQFPKVNTFYAQELGLASAVLQFEDEKPFLSQSGNAFLFTSALNKKNSNFQDINLIVPTFYNIAKQSLQHSKLYYTIGNENTYDVVANLQQDQVLTLENGLDNIIPQQQYFNNKVAITTNETPRKASNYTVKYKSEILENVSYNYNRAESNLSYIDLSVLDNALVTNSISELFDTIKSDSKINELWKWFVILALILLCIEMLILKYFK